MKRMIPSVKRAVTRLVHEELDMAELRAKYQEGECSASDMHWQQNNLEKARHNYNRQMTKMAVRLGEE